MEYRSKVWVLVLVPALEAGKEQARCHPPVSIQMGSGWSKLLRSRPFDNMQREQQLIPAASEQNDYVNMNVFQTDEAIVMIVAMLISPSLGCIIPRFPPES